MTKEGLTPGVGGAQADKTSNLAPKSPSNHPINLKKFKEAQLFATPQRATLTFLMGTTVGSIHFDKARGEIFYRGHNIQNFNLTQEQWAALQAFPQYLKQHDADKDLIRSYGECLSRIWPKP